MLRNSLFVTLFNLTFSEWTPECFRVIHLLSKEVSKVNGNILLQTNVKEAKNNFFRYHEKEKEKCNLNNKRGSNFKEKFVAGIFCCWKLYYSCLFAYDY